MRGIQIMREDALRFTQHDLVRRKSSSPATQKNRCDAWSVEFAHRVCKFITMSAAVFVFASLIQICNAQSLETSTSRSGSKNGAHGGASDNAACRIETEFMQAKPSIGEGEKVAGILGEYAISIPVSTTAELIFDEEYVSRYAKKVEDELLTVAKQSLCIVGKNDASIQVTFIELSFFEDFDLDQIPPYGLLDYDMSTNSLYGVFVWNPRQILSDQYLLHTRKYPSYETGQISYNQFSEWAGTYHRFLEGLPSREISRELAAIPEDILWLFEVSPGVTRISFELVARRALLSMISGSEPGYSYIAIELIRYEIQTAGKVEHPSLENIFFPNRVHELFSMYTYNIAQ